MTGPITPNSSLSTGITPTRYVTADIPGLGGVIKQRPEDFLVDEQPLYQPSGEGEHIYMLIQKKMMSTLEMIGIIAKHFGVTRRDVGFAGLKDKHAITRQVVSVYAPAKKIEDFPMLQHESLGVLWADYHNNKLRPGHLRGNRFSIRIRNVEPTRVRDALRVMQTLRRTGVPNRFGEQRFGMLANNHLIGRSIICGDWIGAVRELLGPNATRPEFNADARRLFTEGKFREAIMAYPLQATIETRVLNALSQGKDARRAFQVLDETSIRFYLSAFQSAVFNAVLDDRLAKGTLGSLNIGDVAIKHENGAVFAVDDATFASPDTHERLATFDISPSGPMWGTRMLQGAAGSECANAERTALENAGVTLPQLEAFDNASRYPLEGKRRPLRVPVIDPEVEGGVDEHGPYVRCAFELPRGSFATVAMREVMKPAEGTLAEEDVEESAAPLRQRKR